MFDITDIAKIAITLICAVISTFLIPWIKSKTNEKQREMIKGWVSVAVAAAEQIYRYSEDSYEKYHYVRDFLLSRGITYDENEIEALIEAEVYRLKLEQGIVDAKNVGKILKGAETIVDEIKGEISGGDLDE